MKTYKKLPDLTPEQEAQMKQVEIYSKHHGRPLTRREFLASGALLSTASIVLPSALSLISESAMAQSCGSNKLAAFVSVNLGGGASLAGNAIALNRSGGLLSTYAPLGLGSQASVAGSAQKVFGTAGPSFGSISSFMTALVGATSVTTRDRTSMLLVCFSSTDDTATNKIDPTPLIVKAKATAGAFLPPLGENRNQPAVLADTPALNVTSLNDISSAIGVQGSIAQLTSAQKERLFRSAQRLSESQARNLASVSGGNLFSELIEKATGTNTQLIGNTAQGIDPRTQNGLNGVWNFNNAAELRDASLVYNTIRGNAVSANISMGGYDYHGQGRATQDQRDGEAGTKVGQILETAAVMGEKICVSVTSDGSVGHQLSTTPGSAATGDRGTHGMAYVFFFDPIARPQQRGSQVGAFRSAGTDSVGVDEQTLIGGSPERGIAAIFANYLSFIGQAGRFDSIAPRIFTVDELNREIIKIG